MLIVCTRSSNDKRRLSNPQKYDFYKKKVMIVWKQQLIDAKY